MNMRVGGGSVSWRSVLWALLLAVVIGVPSARADQEAVALHADIEKDVIYCDVQLGQNLQSIATALEDGTQMTFTWTVKVYEVKPYWLDSEVASVHVVHQVIPDLVTRRWLLVDQTSGIHQRTDSLGDALDFLTQLQHFPVIDRSLLSPGKSYRLEIQLQEDKGEIERGWWARLWGHEQTTGTLVFTLP